MDRRAMNLRSSVLWISEWKMHSPRLRTNLSAIIEEDILLESYVPEFFMLAIENTDSVSKPGVLAYFQVMTWPA